MMTTAWATRRKPTCYCKGCVRTAMQVAERSLAQRGDCRTAARSCQEVDSVSPFSMFRSLSMAPKRVSTPVADAYPTLYFPRPCATPRAHAPLPFATMLRAVMIGPHNRPPRERLPAWMGGHDAGGASRHVPRRSETKESDGAAQGRWSRRPPALICSPQLLNVMILPWESNKA